jgi:hypothetical protein
MLHIGSTIDAAELIYANLPFGDKRSFYYHKDMQLMLVMERLGASGPKAA